MKRWGILVTGIYVIMLTALTLPLLYATFGPKDMTNAYQIYQQLPYWVVILVMICAEMLLLFVPVHYAERRPKGRRPLLVPVITSALLMGILTALFFSSIVLAIWGDDGPPRIDRVTDHISEGGVLCIILGIMIALWVGWAFIFHHRFRAESPEGLMERVTTWMLRGSIIELLIAVSCHVIVRRRDDCCAPLGTFIGIAAGFSVMLLSFGPGIIFLFAARRRKLNSKG